MKGLARNSFTPTLLNSALSQPSALLFMVFFCVHIIYSAYRDNESVLKSATTSPSDPSSLL